VHEATSTSEELSLGTHLSQESGIECIADLPIDVARHHVVTLCEQTLTHSIDQCSREFSGRLGCITRSSSFLSHGEKIPTFTI
jgi:hypothetical protein